MKPIGVIFTVFGFAMMFIGAVLFFGRDAFAREFLGATFLFGAPLTQDDKTKVDVVLLLGLFAGVIGFCGAILGGVFLAIGMCSPTSRKHPYIQTHVR